MNDPIVEEVRKVRDAHARRFNYDLAAICEDIRQHQELCGHRLVTLRRRKNEDRQADRAATSR